VKIPPGLIAAAVVWAALCFARSGRPSPATGPRRAGPIEELLAGQFRWTCGPPVVAPIQRPEDPCYSVKDPSIVRYRGRWHLFCTIRSRKRSHQIEYLSFADWADADKAKRHVLALTDGYFCAPQVFHFRPHKKWYLICQVIDKSRKPALQPAWSTTTDLADPASWSAPALLFAKQPGNVGRWIDFWIICDAQNAHLFFTSLDGRMWRAQARLTDFPGGWSRPEVVLRGDIFEAGHVYRLRGLEKYLAAIEAQAGGRRYYKAYLADRLEGPWQALAATRARAFAAPANVRFSGEAWTTSFSHGEMLRAGFDERLEVDPADVRLLFQGVSDQGRRGKKYGEIPWRLGLLKRDG